MCREPKPWRSRGNIFRFPRVVLCMDVCMVMTSSRRVILWDNRVRRLPIMLARGQLNMKKNEFSTTVVVVVPIRVCLGTWSHETGSIVPSRVSLLILHTQAESGLTRGIPPDFRDDIHPHKISSTAIGSQGAQQLISYYKQQQQTILLWLTSSF